MDHYKRGFSYAYEVKPSEDSKSTRTFNEIEIESINSTFVYKNNFQIQFKLMSMIQKEIILNFRYKEAFERFTQKRFAFFR